MNQVPRPSRSTEIKSILETEIEQGELPPGASMDERALAARFGVSRTPVREALQQLAAQSLVQIVPRQGVFVAKMTVPQLREMLELLGEMEAVSAKLAARRMSDTQRDALTRAINAGVEALEAGDGRGFAKANEAFHDVIYAACHNEYLAGQIRSIRRLIGRYRPKLFLTPVRRAKALEEHRKLGDALLSGDEAAAQTLMMEHAPVGAAGFSEFLATLPPEYFSTAAPVAADFSGAGNSGALTPQDNAG
ncbi:GntR family transcriptional regulator [Paraburkholderia sp. MMS20-SJTR3]|uniref:GntR family transcriptional regulator n=1 Tax=Paraburkholderia sejongensis TaxID=2886946 RepID=A0ABS8K1P1_9BURK|nr:GntR family transcriptional regulator [Paraburkholderia sp. MMS20-SJTR3]MCC8395829.1 GntR family transcriptional regulator [Paraburkholderia sp. MMS20-SJTR3]